MPKYDKLAKYYDLIDCDKTRFIEFIKTYIKKYKNQASNILELGCGTGNILKYFSDEFECHGIDISGNMIDIASKKNNRIKYCIGDIRELSMSMRFDVIISMFDTLNHLSSEDELKKVSMKVSDHLNKGGLFIFDINSINLLNRVKESNKRNYITENVSIESIPESDNQLLWRIKENDLIISEVKEKLFDLNTIKRSFNDYFDILEIKDINMDDITEDTTRIFFVCRKID